MSLLWRALRTAATFVVIWLVTFAVLQPPVRIYHYEGCVLAFFLRHEWENACRLGESLVTLTSITLWSLVCTLAMRRIERPVRHLTLPLILAGGHICGGIRPWPFLERSCGDSVSSSFSRRFLVRRSGSLCLPVGAAFQSG